MESGLAGRRSQTVEWMADLAREEGVKLIMIYDGWLPERPSGGVRLGSLKSQVPLSVVGGDEVAFYAPDHNAIATLRPQIAVWAAGLPKEAYFEIDQPALAPSVSGVAPLEGLAKR